MLLILLINNPKLHYFQFKLEGQINIWIWIQIPLRRFSWHHLYFKCCVKEKTGTIPDISQDIKSNIIIFRFLFLLHLWSAWWQSLWGIWNVWILRFSLWIAVQFQPQMLEISWLKWAYKIMQIWEKVFWGMKYIARNK